MINPWGFQYCVQIGGVWVREVNLVQPNNQILLTGAGVRPERSFHKRMQQATHRRLPSLGAVSRHVHSPRVK